LLSNTCLLVVPRLKSTKMATRTVRYIILILGCFHNHNRTRRSLKLKNLTLQRYIYKNDKCIDCTQKEEKERAWLNTPWQLPSQERYSLFWGYGWKSKFWNKGRIPQEMKNLRALALCDNGVQVSKVCKQTITRACRLIIVSFEGKSKLSSFRG